MQENLSKSCSDKLITPSLPRRFVSNWSSWRHMSKEILYTHLNLESYLPIIRTLNSPKIHELGTAICPFKSRIFFVHYTFKNCKSRSHSFLKHLENCLKAYKNECTFIYFIKISYFQSKRSNLHFIRTTRHESTFHAPRWFKHKPPSVWFLISLKAIFC